MPLDPDEVEQIRNYFHDRQLRWECMALSLQLGEIKEQHLRLFATGAEGWRVAILPGSPDLN